MPFGGYNVGRDVQIDFLGSFGVLQSFSFVTGFSRKQRTQSVEIIKITGETTFMEIPNGWEVTLELERASSLLDDYIAALEAGYYNGQNILGSTLTETITEVSGAVTQYRYTGVAVTFEDAGEWRGNQSVKQRLMCKASRRIKVL